MTLDQLRIFVSVAEREHMTRAAETLNVAQSAVSTVIAKLEGDLELRLFERAGRNVRLALQGMRSAIRPASSWITPTNCADGSATTSEIPPAGSPLRCRTAAGRLIAAPLADVDSHDVCAASTLPIRSSCVAEVPTDLRAGIDELIILICEIAALEAPMADAGAAGQPRQDGPPLFSRHTP